VLMNSIHSDGIICDGRGKPWLVAPADPSGRYLLISWGTLGRAMLRAVKKWPTHPNIVASVGNGLCDAQVFSPDTPEDVLCWLRDFHNLLHDRGG
jgi:hypothetical protein